MVLAPAPVTRVNSRGTPGPFLGLDNASATSVGQEWNLLEPFGSFTVQTNAAATIQVQGSVTGLDWVTLDTLTFTGADIDTASGPPVPYMRLRITSGSNVTAWVAVGGSGGGGGGSAGSAGIEADPNNSTTTPLGAGATFTGTATDISDYAQVNIEIYGRPSQILGDASTAMGSFFFEFSPDGTNWDISVPALVRDPGLVIPVPVINVGQWFRVRYLNDGGVLAIAILGLSDTAGTPTTQTVFRLTTQLLPQATKELTRTMDQGIQGSDAAVLVRAGIMAKNPSNTYTNVGANAAGSLLVATESEVITAFGYNSTIGTGATVTTAFVEVKDYAGLSVITSATGLIRGTVEFSHDGTAGGVITGPTTPFAGAGAFTVPVQGQYARIKVENLSGGIITFFMEWLGHTVAPSPFLFPVIGPIDPSFMCMLTKGVLTGQNPDGAFVEVGTSRSKAMRTQDDRLEVATFGELATSTRVEQIQVNYVGSMFPSELAAKTESGGGTATVAESQLRLASSTAATSTARVQTREMVRYRAGHEVMAVFTAAWTTPGIANSFMRAGLFDDDDGFWIGYSGTSFGVARRRGGVDTFTAQASWDPDPLQAGTYSLFQRDGVSEALDPTKLNVYRVRFGWLGAAPVVFEVLSPDGQWLEFHRIRWPNTSADDHILDPNLPIRFEIVKSGAAATDLALRTGSWSGSVRGIAHDDRVEDANSTSTALGSSGVFTGAWVNVEHYVAVAVALKADQNSASQGLQIQFSNDAVTSQRSVGFTYDTAGTGQMFAVGSTMRFMRVVYTNGGTAQGSFVLQTSLHTSGLQNPQVPLTAALLDQQPTLMSRTVLTAKKPDTTYGNIGATASGNLDMNLAEVEVPVPIKALSGWEVNGTGSVTASASQIAASPPANTKTVSVKANPGNTKVIYIGHNSSVGLTSGWPLAAGDSIDLEFDTTPQIWCRSESGTQAVHWLYIYGTP